MTSFLLASLIAAQPGPGDTLEDVFRSALGSARLTAQSARFDPSILPFYRQGEFETPFTKAAYEDPWRIPFLTSAPRRQLFVSSQRPAETIGVLSRLLGDGASRDLLGNPIQPTIEKTKAPGSFEAALNRMKRQGLISGAIPSVREVPEEVQRAAALILESCLDAYSYRTAAFANAPEASAVFSLEVKTPLLSDDAAAYQRRIAFARKLEMSYLYAGAQEITTAAVEARRIIGVIGQNVDYSFSVDTTWGQISLSSRSVTQHGAKPIFIAIDTAGDDLWINAASTRSYNNWASIVLDTQGRDSYLSNAELRNTEIADWPNRTTGEGDLGPAAAAFGVAVCIDGEGNDTYRTAAPGIGSAIFGTSYLLDVSGNDKYDCYADGIGTARFGIGVVEDLEGDDSYQGFTRTQGCGLVRGAGAVIDRSGSDTYTANDSEIDFPSAQSKEHNLSCAQGAGVGSRADYLNGKSLAGGIGILYDTRGDDTYLAGVFGQGVGYWMGCGLLWDDEGVDQYRTVWFGQGAAAHFSVGCLEDRSGSDVYLGQRFYSQGAGHDFAVGILVDVLGDDRYTGGTVSGGAASENGIGIFADMSGKDTYEMGGISLGYAAETSPGSLRERALSLGVFLDLGGVDDYKNSALWAKNGAQSTNWRSRKSLPEESQLGIFVDR